MLLRNKRVDEASFLGNKETWTVEKSLSTNLREQCSLRKYREQISLIEFHRVDQYIRSYNDCECNSQSIVSYSVRESMFRQTTSHVQSTYSSILPANLQFYLNFIPSHT